MQQTEAMSNSESPVAGLVVAQSGPLVTLTVKIALTADL
jgi:hypothetical protein